MFKLFKKVPIWGWFTGIIFTLGQWGLYSLAPVLSKAFNTIDYKICPKIGLDDNIPLLVGFVFIYTIVSYSFWVVFPVIISALVSKEHFINIAFTALVSIVVGAIILVFVPTYMDRELEGLLDAVNKPGLANLMLKSIYKSDGWKMAYNLAPSFHCMLSTLCYLGIHNEKNTHIGFKISSLIIAILICISTLFTKQHYFIDVISGILLACLSYTVIYFINPGKRIIEKKEA